MMFEVPLLGRQYEDVHCPNCGLSERVSPPLPPGSSRYHNCPRMHDLSAPLIPVAVDAKVEAVEREDYLRKEIQTTGSDGKAYMAIRTTYANGSNDLVVNAPLARGNADNG